MIPWLLLWILLSIASASVVRAEERYAVVVGNNRGQPDETQLRYAQEDAEKVASVLRQLGAVRPENLTLLLGEDADTVRHAIIRVNERLRTQAHGPVQLVVYYSGHADSEALHLGETLFSLAELAALVNGSAATLRLLVVDACRSGALTRVKGGTQVPAVAVQVAPRVSGAGAVFLSASAASEDAQESDTLRGSFFTHYLVTGLRGAADTDRDGSVDLDEAYTFAYGNTLRASSRTLAGSQHPTYRHELKGHGHIVVTRWKEAGKLSTLLFPSQHTWLLFQGSELGSVVGEIPAGTGQRVLVVPSGTYFVRGRTPQGLLEATLTVTEGQRLSLSTLPMADIAYARLVRKGVDGPSVVQGVSAGYRMRTSLESDGALCHGAFTAYSLDLQHATVSVRAGFCRGGYQSSSLRAVSDELDAELRLHKPWDLPWLTLELGAGLGAGWLSQRFESDARTHPRDALAVHGDAAFALVHDFFHALDLRLEAAGMLYLFRREGESRSALEPVFAARLTAGLGYHF